MTIYTIVFLRAHPPPLPLVAPGVGLYATALHYGPSGTSRWSVGSHPLYDCIAFR